MIYDLILVLANYAELVIYDWAPVTRNRKRQLKIMADADTEPLTTEVSKIGHTVRTTPFRIYSMIYGLGGTIYILETTEIIKVVNRSLDGETGHV